MSDKDKAAMHAKIAADAAKDAVAEEVTENVEQAQQVFHQAARRITPRNVAFVALTVSIFGSGVAYDLIRRNKKTRVVKKERVEVEVVEVERVEVDAEKADHHIRPDGE